MKTLHKNESTCTAKAVTAFACTVFLFLSHAAQGQEKVKIEGGPGPIQISDEDGEPEGAGVPFPDDVTSEPLSFPALESELATSRQKPIIDSEATAFVPPKKTTNTPVAEVKAGVETTIAENPRREYTPAERKRLEWLEKELGMQDGYSIAKLSISTSNLFAENSLIYNEGAEAILANVAEYLTLREPASLEVSYRFNPETEAALDARKRMVQFAETLQLDSNYGEMDVTLNDPRPDAPEAILEDGKLGETAPTRVSVIEVTIR